MDKSNLYQLLVGILLATICYSFLSLGWFSLFPAVLVGICWGGYVSLKNDGVSDGKNTRAKFWKGFACVSLGGIIETLLLML